MLAMCMSSTICYSQTSILLKMEQSHQEEYPCYVSSRWQFIQYSTPTLHISINCQNNIPVFAVHFLLQYLTLHDFTTVCACMALLRAQNVCMCKFSCLLQCIGGHNAHLLVARDVVFIDSDTRSSLVPRRLHRDETSMAFQSGQNNRQE